MWLGCEGAVAWIKLTVLVVAVLVPMVAPVGLLAAGTVTCGVMIEPTFTISLIVNPPRAHAGSIVIVIRLRLAVVRVALETVPDRFNGPGRSLVATGL